MVLCFRLNEVRIESSLGRGESSTGGKQSGDFRGPKVGIDGGRSAEEKGREGKGIRRIVEVED